MTLLVRHLASMARLLFSSLPLHIPTAFSPAQLRQRLGAIPLGSGLILTWGGPDRFYLHAESAAPLYRGAAIRPLVRLHLSERDGRAALEGTAALPAFPRSLLIIVLLTLFLLAIGILTQRIPAAQPLRSVPIFGLMLSILEIVHLAVRHSVRNSLARLAEALGPGQI